jgi:hypothetical protein
MEDVSREKNERKLNAPLDAFPLGVNIRVLPESSTPRRLLLVMMMMAHDSSPGPALTDETIEAVRSALMDYVDAPQVGERLGVALRRMALEARARRMLPEQLLIVLKDIWYSLPAVRHIEEPAEQVRLLQRVVTMCIKEYYTD